MYANAKYIKYFNRPSTELVTVGMFVDIGDMPSCYVPIDPTNIHYANIIKLVEEDKLTIAPADEPPSEKTNK